MSDRGKPTGKTPIPGGLIVEFGDGDAEASIDLAKLNDNRAEIAMLREWYGEVIGHAAFVFVEDTTNSNHFLTVYMGSDCMERRVQQPDLKRHEVRP